MVQVTASGSGEVRGVRIDPQAVDPDDVEMLQDMVLAAVTDALRRAKELQGERMGGLTAGLNLPPGLM